ncbi:hypothetical protein B0H10DRAFT_2216875 [Mycena sp. CBHHK59/15]|nr:hypothetical protein B0H10DRAFT_2222621 [Mycena sp. CBHHK59/15]KAJ6619353.1 hypothetical protein B0H10DRAFT_2216875 [Mycena sp. CBHHK59/15]
MVASEAPSPPADVDNPICLAESIPILNERPFIDVPDSEVDRVVLTASPWKAPDHYGLQMGHVQRAWPVIAEWVRELFKSSVRLGAKPTPFKANVATPTLLIARPLSDAAPSTSLLPSRASRPPTLRALPSFTQPVFSGMLGPHLRPLRVESTSSVT